MADGRFTQTGEQIREEVLRRLNQSIPGSGNSSEIFVPLPISHLPDADHRNWDMPKNSHDPQDSYVRRVIEEARRDFLLSDSAERDERLGIFIAHG